MLRGLKLIEQQQLARFAVANKWAGALQGGGVIAIAINHIHILADKLLPLGGRDDKDVVTFLSHGGVKFFCIQGIATALGVQIIIVIGQKGQVAHVVKINFFN